MGFFSCDKSPSNTQKVILELPVFESQSECFKSLQRPEENKDLIR